MSYTSTDLDNLKTALASGELTVKYDGREVTYRLVDELKVAIATVDSELQAAAGTTPKRVVRVHATGKGT